MDFWSQAYQQVPAASLPDDDYLLAEWAGFRRRATTGWLAIKSDVMSPWVLCFDGRWYHPVLSEVACEAWSRRRGHLWQRECDRIRKENRRRVEKGGVPLELPPKPPDNPFFDADGVFVFDGMTGFPTEIIQFPPAFRRTAPVPPENADFPAEIRRKTL